MKTAFRSWRQTCRFRALVSSLRALPATDLQALWIEPSQIPHLAYEATRF